MDRCRPSSFPSFSPRRNDDALPFFFPYFLWCVPMQHGRRRRKRHGSNNAEKTNIFPNGYIKNIGACFYTYMTVRMFLILSKTAIELQEQQEVSRSPGVKGALIRQEAAFLRSSLFLIFVSAPDTSHFPTTKEISISRPRLLRISKKNNDDEGSSIKRVRNVPRFRTKLFPSFFLKNIFRRMPLSSFPL